MDPGDSVSAILWALQFYTLAVLVKVLATLTVGGGAWIANHKCTPWMKKRAAYWKRVGKWIVRHAEELEKRPVIRMAAKTAVALIPDEVGSRLDQVEASLFKIANFIDAGQKAGLLPTAQPVQDEKEPTK